MPAILDKILRIGEGKILRQLEGISQAVNAIEDDFVAMSDEELRGMTDELRERYANGESLDDLMPEARAMNVAIFLDEVNEFNGPLMFIPGSHKQGVFEAGHDKLTTSYPLWTLDEATVTRLVKEGGIVAPTGKAGGMLMFHGNLVHGSSGNITPYPRKIVYLTLNAVSNYIRTPTRPEYIAHRDFTPIQTVDDDALLRLARAHRQAAE